MRWLCLMRSRIGLRSTWQAGRGKGKKVVSVIDRKCEKEERKAKHKRACFSQNKILRLLSYTFSSSFPLPPLQFLLTHPIYLPCLLLNILSFPDFPLYQNTILTSDCSTRDIKDTMDNDRLKEILTQIIMGPLNK